MAQATNDSATMGASNKSKQQTAEHNGSEPEQSTATAETPAEANDMPSPAPPAKKNNVWGWPWVVFLVFLYTFILFWVYFAILQRYWIKLKWNDALPGLDKTAARKFTMRMHMTMGAISLILGPFQFIPAFRRRPKLRPIHRWSGRIYCVCAMLSCVFGLWFIALKQKLVGGYNMTAAFTFAGLAIGVFAFKAWQTARAAKFSDQESYKKALFELHRNWGIRSYSQILAPALYRYWYIMMELFGMYRTPIPLRNGGYCDEHDQCPDYSRTWDAIYCWVYWMSAWLVAEIIIWNLPAYKDSDGVSGGGNSSEVESMTAPLLSNNGDATEKTSSNGQNNTTAATYGSNASSTQRASDIPSDSSTVMGKPAVVNAIGCLLALAAISITVLTFYTIFTDKDDDDTPS